MHYQKRLVLILLLLSFSAEAVDLVNDRQIEGYTKEKGIIVLNFWATWCEPCIEEIPIFIKLQKQFTQYKFIGISLDEVSEQKLVEKFIKSNRMNYTIVLRNGKNFETMVNSVDPEWIGAMPATFVFQDGKRVYSKVGLIKEDELMRVLQSLRG